MNMQNVLWSKKLYLFPGFFIDLEISETFKNAKRDALIRLQNLRLKKVRFFWKISSDPSESRKWVGEWSDKLTRIFLFFVKKYFFDEFRNF